MINKENNYVIKKVPGMYATKCAYIENKVGLGNVWDDENGVGVLVSSIPHLVKQMGSDIKTLQAENQRLREFANHVISYDSNAEPNSLIAHYKERARAALKALGEKNN